MVSFNNLDVTVMCLNNIIQVSPMDKTEIVLSGFYYVLSAHALEGQGYHGWDCCDERGWMMVQVSRDSSCSVTTFSMEILS